MSSYRKFIEQADLLTAKLQARYSKHLACRAGCSGCCRHHLSVFAVEAEEARAAIEILPAQVRASVEGQAREVIKREARGEPVACPLLVNDRCSIYESRPMICRTQGLPLLMEAEDGEQLCPFVHSVVGWPKLTPASLEPRLSWAGRVALSLAAGFPYRAARGVAARFPTPPQGAEAALGRFGTAASHASLRPVRGQAQRRIAPASPLL